MKYLLSIFCSMLLVSMLAAQTQTPTFLNSGTITFERIINVDAILPRLISNDGKVDEATVQATMTQIKQMSKTKFSKRIYQLQFEGNKTFYQPQDASAAEDNMFMGMAANINEVYSDLNTGKKIAKKNAFGKSYTITDSLAKFKWKLTDETREIAGYHCHRANGLMADSIYVVAFFTDQIPCTAGPESFNGLPGMILGVSLPHEHISWFATKVETQVNSVDKWKIPAENKAQPAADFKKTVLGFLSSIGNQSGGSWMRQILFY